jgi:hypothetical protein
MRSRFPLPFVAPLLLVVLLHARADDAIDGVQPAALDQPRAYMALRRDAGGPILKTKGKADESVGAVEAFLDTGASGVVLSSETAQQLAVRAAKTPAGQDVTFEDVGVGGVEKFGVSEPLLIALAPYPDTNAEDPANYGKPLGPIRAQIRPEGGILAMLAPGLDVAGMPVMVKQVVVLDPTPLAKFDKIHTRVLTPGDKSIPNTTRHVPLTYVSFAKFVHVKPAGAEALGPTLVPNPMIGPDPFAAGDRHKPITIRHKGKTATGTFLLDTGAATSMMSTRMAQQLGIKLVNGKPQGVAKNEQFELSVGGLGGMKSSGGLYADRLELPTTEGPPLAYVHAPLLIADISIPTEGGKTFTLDGVLGMNYFVASAEVSGGLIPDIGKIVDGPFRWVVIDHARGLLGVTPR